MYGSERINLTDDGRVYYVPYIPDSSPELPLQASRPSVLVLPGGGLACLSAREGESVALAFAAKGFNAFVLHYSLNEYASWPFPLWSAQAVTCFCSPAGRGVRYFIVTTVMPCSFRNRRAGATSKPFGSLPV